MMTTTTIEAPTSTRLRDAIRGALRFHSVLLALLALLVLILLKRDTSDPDLWWHLRNAEYFWSHYSFPFQDIYSFTAGGAAWVPHEWLSELLFYQAFKLGGLPGVFVVSFTLCLLITIGLLYLCYIASEDIKNSYLVTIVAVLLGTVSFGPRTLLVGWLWLIVLLMLLAPLRSGRPAKLWPIPLLFLVWVNSHGSWLIGLVILGIVIVGGIWDFCQANVVAVSYSRPQLSKLLGVFAASVAALFVNPAGYRVVLYPLDLRFRQNVAVEHVQEWASVNFHEGRGLLLICVILAILAAALFSRKRWRLEELGFVALSIYMSLTYTRMGFLLAILVAPVLAARCDLLEPYDGKNERPFLNAAVVGICILLMILVWPSAATIQGHVTRKYPVSAVDYMRSAGVRGNVFNDYLWGGYLIWTLRNSPVFIDGRADIYDHRGVFRDYIDAIGITRPLEVMDKYSINYALLMPSSPLAYVLKNSSQWRAEYSDNVAILFHRVGSHTGGNAP